MTGQAADVALLCGMPDKRVFDLIERIASLLRSGARRHAMPHELQPVHLQALDYLQRANRYSDTPQAVGEYLGLTKGNMSQRLNVLEQLGLVRKQADANDGRLVHLQVTPAGKRLLRQVYPPSIWRQLDRSALASSGEPLERELAALLRALISANRLRSFGQCNSCRFHERRNARAFCALLQVDLEAQQVERICREHQPAV